MQNKYLHTKQYWTCCTTRLHFGGVLCYSRNKQQWEIKMPMSKKGKKKKYSAKRKGKKMGY